MDENRKKAQELRTSGEYRDAIKIYEKLYDNSEDDWLAWEYAKCLKEVNELDIAITVCKKTYERNSKFKHNRDLLAWILFEKYFKKIPDEISFEEINHLFDITMYIPKLVMQTNTSPYTRIVFKMLKTIKYSSNPNYERILNLLSLLDPALLSSIPKTYNRHGKEKEYQSDKESYFAYKTKALLELERFEECKTICETALSEISQFNHDNDVWIKVRRAKCIGELSVVENAINELEDVLVKKQSWIILSEIAKLKVKIGDISTAMVYYSRCFLTKDPIKMKVSLLNEMMKIINDESDSKVKELHALLQFSVRQNEGWKIQNSLQTIIDNSSIKGLTYQDCYKELTEYWINIIYKNMEFREGVISNIHKNNKFGFISCGKNSYYFQMKSVFGHTKLKKGMKVSFTLIDSFDNRKEIMTKEAAYITV